MGWEPTVTYQTDSGGRVISSRAESEWTPDEQGKMLALTHYERADKCPVCGGPKAECQDSDNEMRYKATPPVRCFYRTAVSQEQEQWRTDERRYPEALMPQVRLKE